MKDYKKDKFEAFIENSLSGYEENPSDLLWENLETKIPAPPEQSSNSKSWLFILVLLLFIGGGGYWLKYNSDIMEVNATLQNQEEKINSIAQEVAKINSTLGNKINTSSLAIEENTMYEKEEKQLNSGSNKIIQTKNQKPTLHSDLNNNTKTDNVKTDFQNNFSKKSNLNQNITQSDKIISFPNISQQSIYNKTITNKKNNIPQYNTDTKSQVVPKSLKELMTTPMENISSILGLVISENKKEEDLNKIDLIDLIGKKERKIGFEFYSFYGALFPDINFESPINDFKKQNSKNFSIGLLHNIHFNKKWTLQIGLEVTERTIGSNFTKALQYGNVETLINNDQYQSNSSYQINTNYGRQIFNSYIVNNKMNDGLDIETGDYFLANINIVRTQKYFAIPLLFKYNISNPYKKLRWSAKGGIIDRIYFQENDIGEVAFQNISSARLEHNYTIVENVGHGNTATRLGVEVVLAAGMEYHFNDNLGIIIEPQFKKNILERTKINPYTIGFYSGLRWTFNK